MGFIRFFGRFRHRWGDMEHRSEEPLGESSGDEQDWSNRTCGIGCELPSDPENEDEAYYGYGRQEGHAKPNSNHPGPVLLSKFLNFCWAGWAHCVSR